MNSASAERDLATGPDRNSTGRQDTLHLRMSATSANLGPGFDTLALALTLALDITAKPAPKFSLIATGRNRDICSAPDRNLLLDVYEEALSANGAPVVPLSLEIHNEIPVGMGCGSSAAVRLAALAMANHFAGLGWSGEKILNEACRLEGHPDNVAACWLGGLTVATSEAGAVQALKIISPAAWQVLLVIPEEPLATSAARSVLPGSYGREDAVFNIQRASLLTAAFAAGRGDFLRTAMRDRMHQPFRGKICPLLPRLEPLAGREGILGVCLSGAGPSVLLLIEDGWPIEKVRAEVTRSLKDCSEVEQIECGMETSAALVASSVAAE